MLVGRWVRWSGRRRSSTSSGLPRRTRSHVVSRRRQRTVLVINDELLEARAGGIGLWVGLATIGYFRNIEIEPR